LDPDLLVNLEKVLIFKKFILGLVSFLHGKFQKVKQSEEQRSSEAAMGGGAAPCFACYRNALSATNGA
jgi:hypothetical protein